MFNSRYSLRAIVLMAAVGTLAGSVPDALGTDLKAETVEGFNRYVRATEARIEKDLARPGAYLYVEGFAEPRRSQALGLLKGGQVFMERLETRDVAGRELRAPDAIIHHWLGAVFIPGASLRQTLDLVQDYDHHEDYYKPEVLRSRLVSRNGNNFVIYYRLRKHKVVTVTLNTDHDVQYVPVDATRCYSRSYSTRIAEVADADKPSEREEPVGHDNGFLWRMNSYWRFEERDGGVYVECESISLTRDIPTGLGWLIRPFITGIPRESLQMTMRSTRAAVLARRAAASTH